MLLRDRIPPAGLLTTDDITRLGVPAATVRDWVRRGRLQHAGGTARFPRYRVEDVLPLVEARAARSRQEAA
ncbi:helix-turn-helix domain-containing protein [Kitasatospora purpeofusca]|uniref:helix-turn-helix domain-containing protein n=1 Tax=Kitasatospora purpeofusca TaxID=67352 RepID=UPI003689ECF3